MNNDNIWIDMDTNQDGSWLLGKVKDWMNSLDIASKSRMCIVDTELKNPIHLALYPKESIFSVLPTFHVIFLIKLNSIDLRLLSYNETLLFQETLSKDNPDFEGSKMLDLISSSKIRLCSGLISNDDDQDVLIETLSSKKVCRSMNCSYILTKKNDLCCRSCLYLNSSFDNDPLYNFLSSGEEADEQDDDDDEDFLPEGQDYSVPSNSKKRKKSLLAGESSSRSLFRCNICCSTFYHKGYYKTHMANHDGFKDILEEAAICPICSEQIPKKIELNSHIRKVHPERKEELCCFVCYKFVKNLGSHLNSAHDPRTVVCSKCGKNVRHRYYTEHMTLHDTKEDRRVVCPVCGKIICRKSNLSIHIKVMHSDESERVLACEVCGKTFTHMKVLKKHLEVHQERKYKCKLCEYKTYRKSNVAVHLKKSHHLSENVYNYVEDTSLSN